MQKIYTIKYNEFTNAYFLHLCFVKTTIVNKMKKKIIQLSEGIKIGKNIFI